MKSSMLVRSRQVFSSTRACSTATAGRAALILSHLIFLSSCLARSWFSAFVSALAKTASMKRLFRFERLKFCFLTLTLQIQSTNSEVLTGAARSIATIAAPRPKAHKNLFRGRETITRVTNTKTHLADRRLGKSPLFSLVLIHLLWTTTTKTPSARIFEDVMTRTQVSEPFITRSPRLVVFLRVLSLSSTKELHQFFR